MLEPPPRFDASPIVWRSLNGDGEEFLTIRLYGPPHDSCIPSARHRRGHPFRPRRHRNRACSSGSVPAFDAAIDPFDSGQAGAGSKACRQACTDGQDQRSQAHSGGSGGCAAGAAAAAAKPAQAATGPGGASLLTSYGDWGVYTAQTGRSKICYALSQPKDRLPKNLNRDPAYLFVSFRPAENVRNEVALVLGFTAKENGPAEAAIGNASYALLTKDCQCLAEEPRRGRPGHRHHGAAAAAVTVKTQSARGTA